MICVAIFQEDLGPGGIQKALVNLLNSLDYKKYKVDLYLWEGNLFFKDINKNVNVIFYNQHSRFVKKILKYIPVSLQLVFLKNTIKKQYDIAIDFSGYANFCAAAALKVSAHRHLIWVHGDVTENLKTEPKFRILWKLYKNKFKKFDKIIAVSDWSRESFLKQVTIYKEKVSVVNNQIEVSEIIKLSKEKFSGFPKENIHLIAVGRLTYQKGYDILLSEFSRAYTKNPKLRLHIIGNGPERRMLEKQANNLNINNVVKFYGNQKNPYKFMAASDVFVSTSRFEGQGLAILEAKVLGLPIILSQNLQKTVGGNIRSYNFVDEFLKLKRQTHKKNNLSNYNQKSLKDFELAIDYKPRIIWAASTGGHLSELRQLDNLMKQYNSLLVTEKDKSTEKLCHRDSFIGVKFLKRDVNSNFLKKVIIGFKNYAAGRKIVRNFRPDFVIDTGAFSASLLSHIAHKFGAKTIHIESAANINTPSMSGKFSYKFADLFIIQNNGLKKYFKNAKYGGTIFNLLQRKSKSDKLSDHILVLLGTQRNQFPRLLNTIDKISVQEKIIVQAGYTKFNSSKMEIKSLLDQREYERLNYNAKIIITHAGVGSIYYALSLRKPVIVVPRLKKYGEHLNNHQLQIAKDLAKKNFIILVDDLKNLEDAITQARSFKPPKIKFDNSKMIKMITEFINEN